MQMPPQPHLLVLEVADAHQGIIVHQAARHLPHALQAITTLLPWPSLYPTAFHAQQADIVMEVDLQQ